jgi:glycosyltransferase involved in cell wall biosynthesis
VSAPAVSVVTAVRDDRQRLPRAVASALAQPVDVEVVVVDGGSTDGTWEVAQELAARDPRVRVFRYDGGPALPGAPRNRAIDEARGRWVISLDSDDELEPGALGALLEQAESAGVDAAFGRTTRINPDRGTSTDWMPWLFERTGVTTMTERPELVGDTIFVDKLVRRELLHGVRFPEDILYEDVVMTAELATRLDRVLVTDVPLYRWYVRARGDDRSITNSRRREGNAQDRVEANRRAAALLEAAGRHDLRIAKDRKLVDHDLPLLLRDLNDRTRAEWDEVLALVRPLVADLHPEVRESSEQPAAAVLAALAGTDPALVADVAELAYRKQVRRPLEVSGPTYRWPGIASGAGDVTQLVQPLLKHDVLLWHQVRELVARGGRLHLEATTWCRAGTWGGVPDSVVVVDRRRQRRVGRAPVRLLGGSASSGQHWRAEISLAQGLLRTELLGELDLRVVAAVAGEGTRWVLAVPEQLTHDVVAHAFGRQAEAYQTAMGNLSLRRTR